MNKTIYEVYEDGYENAAISFAYIPELSKEEEKIWSLGYKDGLEWHKKTEEEVLNYFKKKVYLVSSGSYDEYTIRGIFTDKEKAEFYNKWEGIREEWEIRRVEEIEIMDDKVEIKPFLIVYDRECDKYRFANWWIYNNENINNKYYIYVYVDFIPDKQKMLDMAKIKVEEILKGEK